jgi:hypothetical protein
MVPSPSPGTLGNQLVDVAAISPNDIWAVGTYFGGERARSTLTLHWDGNQWSVIPSPNYSSGDNDLQSVVAIASDDVWAVGFYDIPSAYATLTLRWDGFRWTQVPSPNPSLSTNVLFDIATIAGNNIWAVGKYSDGGLGRTLILHWDGTQWTQVPSPSPAVADNVLFGIAGVSPDDIWAVGMAELITGTSPLIEHWDGAQWRLVPNPPPSQALSELHDVEAVTANDVWAVGYISDDGTGQGTVLVEHWNGTAWSIAQAPSPAQVSNQLHSIAAVSTGDIWSVGEQFGGNGVGFSTLIERYNNPCVTPPPTSSSTTTPSSTATPPLATPTPCSGNYADVPEGSTFYTYIMCLSARGIVSGYSDCTFRPNNDVTRGQFAKIVAGAAGFTDPPVGQTFEDVPPGSTFYTFTERLASRSIISGYPCGSPGEPCGGGNLPYFRPGANITRGQISTIVAAAAGLTQPAGAQQYEDVPVGHTFYDYIWRLTDQEIMSGYLCGNPEPCVPPVNLPYFRPWANATRGQASKIVANTFFPGCETP